MANKRFQNFKHQLYFSYVISIVLDLTALHLFLLPFTSMSLHALCRSQQWQQMTRADREKMGLIVRDVGEFW